LSILHAEVLALSLAQRKLNTFDLNQSALELELITSTEPCAMCLGAIPWSGIRRVVTAASGQDAEAIGFDEGDKPENWQEGLTRRGIEVITRVCPDEAKAVLNNYAKMNGPIYNSKN
jgi:tRNA(Arg) A34 adenosine deaminase TadA